MAMTNNPGKVTPPKLNKPPVGSPGNPSEVPKKNTPAVGSPGNPSERPRLNNPTSPRTPISYADGGGSSSGGAADIPAEVKISQPGLAKATEPTTSNLPSRDTLNPDR